MDAREFWEIKNEACDGQNKKGTCRGCPFHCETCTVDPLYEGEKDPVAIAEEIKVKRDKPKPAKQFEPGKRYRFSAALKQKDLGYEDPLDAKDDGEEITVIKIRYVSKKEPDVIGYLASGGVYPQWCYEVPAEKPQLPGKTLITFGEKWQYGIKDYFELLLESQNAIIDYLKARENNDSHS